MIPSQTVPFVPSQAPDSRQPPSKIGKLIVVGLFVDLFLCLLIGALIPDHMGTLKLMMDRLSFFAFFAAFIVLFLRGSRPATTHPFATAIVALISPSVSILEIFSGFHFDGRILDVMITLPLVIGAFCGRRAFRATGARRPVRLAGLLAVIVCVPFAFFFLLITFLNFCGGDYNPQ